MKVICEYCEQQVDDYLLENHQKFFHADEFEENTKETSSRVICQHCGEEFDSDKFLQHQKTHKSTIRYDCDECASSFDSQSKLSMHFKNSHAEETNQNELYQCEVCWEVLYDNNKYADHMNGHFGIPRYPKPCPFPACDGETAREFHVMRMHNEIYKKMRKFSCNLCDKRFYQETAALRHGDKIHSDNGPHLCPECGSGFASNELLTEHRPNHINYVMKKNNPKKYVNLPRHESCPICHKTYAPGRKRHIRIQQHIESVHENKNNFKCDICQKAFFKNSQLVRHQKRHFKNDQCTICRIRVDSIKEHYEEFHSNLKETCAICFKKFQAPCYLKKHILWAHTKKSLACDLCGMNYVDIDTIKRHMKIHIKNGMKTHGRIKLVKLESKFPAQKTLYDDDSD